MCTKTKIASWRSHFGRWWLDLYRSDDGVYTYEASGAGGCLNKDLTEQEAIDLMESRKNDFQPDANKTPMIRVF